MATRYVRSTDGNDADDGTTWALSKATVAGAAAIDTAGDLICVSQNHAESVASCAGTWAGTNASPTRIVCGNDAAEPPTATATTATVTLTGSSFSWTGGAYTYGIGFVLNSASSYEYVFNGTTGYKQIYESCSFQIGTAGGSSTMSFGNVSSGSQNETVLNNCTFKMGNANHRIGVTRPLIINGGSWLSGGTNPTGVFNISNGGRVGNLIVNGFDFSNLGTTVNLIQSLGEGGAIATIRNAKLPASWTGALVASGQPKIGSRVSMYNYYIGTTAYDIWIEDYAGVIKSERTLVKTGGASDGAGIAWKMTTSANAGYPACPLYSDPMFIRNETTGSSKTVTVDILHDSATALTNAEVWLEIEYLGTSSSPLASFSDDAVADPLTGAANQDTSSVSWTTTGMTNPNKQKLNASITPNVVGDFVVRVALAKASYTIYVDAKPQVA